MDEGIEEKRKRRFKFMEAAYREISGSGPVIIGVIEHGGKLGFSETESLEIAHYLYGEHLLKPLGSGIASITHEGVLEVERALGAPEKPTQHFPAFNLIHIEHMSQSQIQQGTISSTQTGTFSADMTTIRDFVQAYKSKLSEIGLSTTDRQDAEAEIATVEAQLRSSKPKMAILKASVDVLTGFLANVASSAAVVYLKTTFPTVF
jgi:hypothetical protein